MHLESVDPVRDTRWARFVASNPDASIFHHPRWLGTLQSEYGYSLNACCVVQGDALVAGLPLARIESRLTGRRLVALPFSDTCAPLLHPATGEDVRRQLMVALEHEASRLPLEIHAPVADLPSGRLTPLFHHHVVALEPDLAAVERRFSKSQVRRGVAKARREGLVAERHLSLGALDEFYRLHLRTRRRQGMPIQPKRFVRAFSSLFDAGLGFTVLVTQQERTIAAGVFLAFNGILVYKYGASDERYLATRPNNLLFMEAIRWGCANGMHSFDLGRTDLDNEGLAAFKRSWGADERTLSYTHTSERAPEVGDGRTVRTMKALIRRGPPGLSRLTGGRELRRQHDAHDALGPIGGGLAEPLLERPGRGRGGGRKFG